MQFLTRFCATCGADSQFEKARLGLLYQSNDPPSEEDMQQVLWTLKGEDQKTPISFAFGALMTRLKQKNAGNEGWLSVIKSLIMIHRSVAERILLQEFMDMELTLVENRQENNKQLKQQLIDQLIQRYYRYLKHLCFILKQKNALTHAKQDKLLYFAGRTSNLILSEMREICEFTHKAFQVIETSKNGHLRHKVNQYIFTLILNDLLNVYSSLVTALTQLLSSLSYLSIDELILLRDTTHEITEFYTQFDEFINAHRFIEGFEAVQLQQPIKLQLVKDITEYISQRQLNQSYSNNIAFEDIGKLIVSQIKKQEHPLPRDSFVRESIYVAKIEIIESQTMLQLKKMESTIKFDEISFGEFKNNYSTDYRDIEDCYKEQTRISFRTQDYLSLVENERELPLETISFTPVIFAEVVFDDFINSYS